MKLSTTGLRLKYSPISYFSLTKGKSEFFLLEDSPFCQLNNLTNLKSDESFLVNN